MGCNWVLAREVAKNPERECDWATVGVAVGLVTAALYLLAGYLLIPLLLPSDRINLLPVARLCLLLIPLDISNQVLLAVEHGRMRWRRYNLLRLSFFVFYLLLIGLIGVTHRNQVRWFVSAFLASELLAVLLRLWIQRKSLAAGKLRFDRCRHLLQAGTPYFGATLSNLISLQLDTILVVSLLDTKSAGIYVVAAAFANGPSSLGDALGITSFAVLSNERNTVSQEKIITGTFRQSALVSCGVGLVLASLIPFLVVPLFGFEFSRAIRPAAVLALAGVPDGISQHPESRIARLGTPALGFGEPVGWNRRHGSRGAVFLAAVRAHGNGSRRFDERLRAVARVGCRRGEMAEDLAASILAVWSGKCPVVFSAGRGFAIAILAVSRVNFFQSSK